MNFKHAKLFQGSAILVALVLSLLTACGGGGGGSAATDTTAPTVTATSPVNTTTGVSVSAPISASFSEAIAAAAIDASSFTLSDGATNVTGTISCDGTTASFTPAANLAYSTTYTATITTSVKDAAGNAMAGNYTWTFTTSPDSTTPTATLTSASIANNGSATVQNSKIGTAYLVRNTLAVTTLADITGAADNLWNSTAITSANSDTSLSVAGLDAGVYKLYTADAADNLSAVASNTAVVTNTTDANRIDLTDAGVAGDEGNLIAPVYVDGNWYFHWDRSGDGTSTDTGSLNGGHDYINQIELDGIFGSSGASPPNRYATFNGVQLALPMHGDVTVATGFRPGTAIDNSPAGETNPTYDDLLAIWDGYNGTGTGTNINGTPPGWQTGDYWSSNISGRANVSLSVGYVYVSADTPFNYVALQVL